MSSAQARSVFDGLLFKLIGLESYISLASEDNSQFPLIEKALSKRNIGEAFSNDEKFAPRN